MKLVSGIKTNLKRTSSQALIAFLIPFAIYIKTLAPTIYNLDSAELTTVAATLGLTRSTGYPLYILIGHIWSKIPIGDVGYRLNLFSAFCGAMTISISWVILRRWSVNPYAAFGALGVLACAPFFWVLSLTAEVYTLQTALMSGLILLLDVWFEKPTPFRFGLAMLWVGLCLGNHLATLLLLPGCVLFVITMFRKERKKLCSAWLGLVGLLLGLSVYLYLPLRYLTSPVFNYAGMYDASGNFHPTNLASWQGFWGLVSGRQFESLMFNFQFDKAIKALRLILSSLWRAFLVIGIGPGLVGIYILCKKNWQWGISLVLMLFGNIGFYISYRAVDVETMYLPIYLIWALFCGVGYQQIFHWLEPITTLNRVEARVYQWGGIILRGVLIGSVIFAMGINWQSVDRSMDWSARQKGEETFQLLEQNALYFGWWDTVPVMEYLQMVEGYRLDVKVINRFLIKSEDLSKLALLEAQQRPVYISSPIPINLLPDSIEVGEIYKLNVLK
jgi:hypothetical protein